MISMILAAFFNKKQLRKISEVSIIFFVFFYIIWNTGVIFLFYHYVAAGNNLNTSLQITENSFLKGLLLHLVFCLFFIFCRFLFRLNITLFDFIKITVVSTILSPVFKIFMVFIGSYVSYSLRAIYLVYLVYWIFLTRRWLLVQDSINKTEVNKIVAVLFSTTIFFTSWFY